MTKKTIFIFFSFFIVFHKQPFPNSALAKSPDVKTFDDISYDITTFNAQTGNEFTASCTVFDYHFGIAPITFIPTIRNQILSTKSTTENFKSGGTTSQTTPAATLDFAAQNINTNSSAKTFTIRGSNLNGDVTLNTNPPFSLSKDSVVYESQLTYSVAEMVSDKTVYVKFSPKVTSNYTDSVTSVSIGADSKVVALSGKAVEPNRLLPGFNHLAANNVITPNDDGRNDIWVIKNIDQYPNNTVKVFDKYGHVVYSKHGYTNDWGGTYNNGPLSQGTYYYIVDFGAGSGLIFTGFITIVRD